MAKCKASYFPTSGPRNTDANGSVKYSKRQLMDPAHNIRPFLVLHAWWLLGFDTEDLKYTAILRNTLLDKRVLASLRLCSDFWRPLAGSVDVRVACQIWGGRSRVTQRNTSIVDNSDEMCHFPRNLSRGRNPWLEDLNLKRAPLNSIYWN